MNSIHSITDLVGHGAITRRIHMQNAYNNMLSYEQKPKVDPEHCKVSFDCTSINDLMELYNLCYLHNYGAWQTNSEAK